MADFKVESLTIEVRMDTGDFLAGVERVTAALDGLSRVANGFAQVFIDAMSLAGMATSELGEAASAGASGMAGAVEEMALRLDSAGEVIKGFVEGLVEGFDKAGVATADAAGAAISGTESLVGLLRELNAHLAELNKNAGKPFQKTQEEADKAKKKTKEVDSEVTKLGRSLGSRVKSVVTGFAAPMLASLALGGLAKNWLSTVGEAAEKTGAVNMKLEEERRKREALSRVTREDIELYRKGREALARFQMMMDRLSATVMRAFGPALGWLVEKFNAITDWVGRNEHNITRFFKALALTMTTLLIPATIKWGAAWLANPITWIIGALMLLALVIDDLMTYMEGGESLFDWGPFLETVKPLVEWLKKAAQELGAFIAQNPGLVAFLAKFLGLSVALKGGWLAIGPAILKTAGIFEKAFFLLGKSVLGAGSIFKAFWMLLRGNPLGAARLAAVGFGGALKALFTIVKANPLGLLITASLLIFENWDRIREFFVKFWGWIEDNFPNFAAWARDSAAAILKFFTAPLEWLQDTIDSLYKTFRWARKMLGFAAPSGEGESGGAFAAPPGGEPGSYGVALGAEFDRMQASINEVSAPVTNNNQRTVTIGDVTVNTAATDPAAAAREIMKVGNLFGGTAAAEGGIR